MLEALDRLEVVMELTMAGVWGLLLVHLGIFLHNVYTRRAK